MAAAFSPVLSKCSTCASGVMDARKGKDKLELIKKDGWVREEHVLSAGINQE